jgi:hypothetical protein
MNDFDTVVAGYCSSQEEKDLMLKHIHQYESTGEIAWKELTPAEQSAVEEWEQNQIQDWEGEYEEPEDY